MSKRLRLGAWVVALVAALAVVVGGIGVAFAAAGGVPDHFKNLKPNDDGTYQLELTVKGDADTETETAADVNVLIVYDVSNSMTSNAGSTRNTRADQAEDIVHDFVANLRSYQSSTDPSNIEMALVTFARTGSIQQTGGQDWTSNLTDANGINRFFDDGGTDGQTKLTYTGNPSYGTNWQSALSNAQTLLGRADDDPTFVIFVTDGAPTASGNGNNAISPNSSLNQLRPFYEAGLTSARAIQTRENTTLYGIYAYGTEADLLDDLMYYANTGTERTIGGGTQPTDNYFTAADSAALTQAIESIFQEIVETLGVGAVSISDGTTSAVETTTGDIAHLLEVDDGSFEYWLSIPVANNQFTRVNPTTGEETTYTVQVNGDTCTVTGGASPITVTGSISGGQFKFKWEGATELSNDKTPPAASFNGTSVDWDLSSVGTLLDGVTYSVTFDVWPSQYTYDTIAEIQNGDKDYDDLDANEKKYLNEDGTLKTNTKAELTYTDTRTDDGEKTAVYTDPEPVGLVAEQMSVHKDWENELDDRETETIGLTVLADEEEFTNVTLSADDNPAWTKDPVYISTGLMRVNKEDGKAQILDHGHDFTFAELGSEQYNWELVTPVIHPMLINGKLYTLILKEEGKFPSVDFPVVHVEGLDDEYVIDGKTYYIAGEGRVSLKAYNYRRSNLNLTKVVTGEDADPDQTFPFTLTVNNSKASSGSASDTNSDYYVWFSIYDTNASATVTDANVSGSGVVGPNDKGYYYAPSGTRITVEMKADWNLRFTNLPTGTTYTFAEGDLADGFDFNKSELTGQYGSQTPQSGKAADSSWETGKTSTGTIQSTNTTYQVTFTNDYKLTDLEITKQWVDASNQDGIRPTDAEFAELLTLSPAVDGATPTVVDNGDNTYTITYTGLPRFMNDEEVTYTVTESKIDGYTTEGSPAEDHGTITNTHEPEVTEATVRKVWDDADDQDGKRPAELKVTLSNGAEVTLNEDNGWTAKVENLPKYASGEEIEYTWTEADIAEYTLTGSAKEGTITTLTNKHVPEKVNIEVEKKWEDEDNQDGKRPESVTVNLLANGDEADTAVLSEDNGWKHTWTNLDKYAGGDEIIYTVTEAKTDVITGEDGPGTYKDEVTGDIAEGYLVTNTHTPETVDVSVKKVWDDDEDRDGKRPDDLTVTLSNGDEVTLGASNDWEATIERLPKYKDGKEIEYAWTEGSLPEGYELTGTATEGYVTTLTNSHAPERTTVTVTKEWDDADDKDGIRPAEITVTLLANGEEAGTAILSEDNEWTYTWTDLYKYAEGKEIAYTVSEEPVEDYDDPEITGTAADGYTIKNHHTAKPDPVTIDPPVQKILEGDPASPATFTFQMKAITEGAPMPEGSEGGVKTIQITGTGSDEFGVVTYTEAGEWVYEITEIDDGEKFYTYDNTVYTLTVKVEEVPDGTQVKLIKTETITGGDSGTAVFTNIYEKPEVGLKVTKTVTSKPANGLYYKEGETVKYKIVVTNTGECDLTDVKVDDELTGDHWVVKKLAAGASKDFTTSYKVTKDDVKAGSVLNAVTAEVENPYDPDEPLKDEDDVEVPTGSDQTFQFAFFEAVIDDVEVPTGSDQTPPKPNPPKKKVIPQTGDDTPTGAMAALTVFGAAALTAGTVLQRRKRK